MASNKYKFNKFVNSLPAAQVESDSATSTPSLGENYDQALQKLQSIQKQIDTEISNVSSYVKQIRNHKNKKGKATSGTEIQKYCDKVTNGLKKSQAEINTLINKFTAAIDQVEKEELKRMLAWVRRQMQETE